MSTYWQVTSRNFGEHRTINALMREYPLPCLLRARYESYLSHSDPVVLALNPFFILEYVSIYFWNTFFSFRASWITLLVCRDDPTPSRGSQLPRAAALIVSSLGFIHDLRAELLEPDTIRGVPLDMDQYKRLFGTARVPTDVSMNIRD
jgi:carnitine O-acetyltransferase